LVFDENGHLFDEIGHFILKTGVDLLKEHLPDQPASIGFAENRPLCFIIYS